MLLGLHKSIYLNIYIYIYVQNGTFMRLCNQIACFRELRFCVWVLWLWLRKLNRQQRAQIPAKERTYLQRSANWRYVLFRIHALVQKPYEDGRMHMYYLTLSHEYAVMTTAQRLGNGDLDEIQEMCPRWCMSLRWLGFQGLVRSTFFWRCCKRGFFWG